MRKYFTLSRLLALTAGALLVIWAFLPGRSADRRYLVRPSDSDLELWILEHATADRFRDMARYPFEFGPQTWYGTGYAHGDSRFVTYTLSAWPDLSAGSVRITAIHITDPAVQIYAGLSCASSPAEWAAFLTGLGFRPTEDDPARPGWVSPDGAVYYRLDPAAASLRIGAPVTNKNNIVF